MITLKDLLNEGKWKYIGHEKWLGDSWVKTWKYSPGFFDMTGNFLKRSSGKLPEIKGIRAIFYSSSQSVEMVIVLANPIKIEKERTTSIFDPTEYYDSFDTIEVVSKKPFNTFEVQTTIRNNKNSEKINDPELNKLIQKMIDELKPELQKYTN